MLTPQDCAELAAVVNTDHGLFKNSFLSVNTTIPCFAYKDIKETFIMLKKGISDTNRRRIHTYRKRVSALHMLSEEASCFQWSTRV